MLLALALMATLAEGHPRFTTRDCSRAPGGRSTRGIPCGASQPAPLFELASTSGAGMGSACGCANITGTKGETVAATRGSSAVCLKQGFSLSLADGDAVTCANDLPVVESDGTALGILVQSGRTNYLSYDRALGTPPWGLAANIGPPTVTNAYAVGLDGVAGSATRMQVPACPGAGTYSIAYQNTPFLGGGASMSGSAFIKGTSGSGSIAIYEVNTSISTGVQIICNYNPTTWTWCGGPGAPLTFVNTHGNGQFGIGCTNNGLPGAANSGAADVLVWGANLQIGGFPLNPINTTTAAASRSADTLRVNASTFPATAYSKAVSITTAWGDATLPSNPNFIAGEVGTASGTDFFINSGASGVRVQNCNGGCSAVTSTPPLGITAGVTTRFAGSSGGGLGAIYKNGSLITGPSALSPAAAPNASTTGIADNTLGLAHLDGIISRICWDSDTSTCR
jgi:hypothetical protein